MPEIVKPSPPIPKLEPLSLPQPFSISSTPMKAVLGNGLP